ncbi:glycosyltransferase family 2 protein [Aureispira anguillae]|uniref:Glycosyltransferase family 2 protein n=1 Tax=Aureispira anguillae TaxID=2864201 RepID=A0A915YEQ9_9BACT|nr:glycosyltransferase family 2 protein [Aureispira anguillae]BDS11689.1 glycosyltransferase family 2 protein [Aureispira anguillae]
MIKTADIVVIIPAYNEENSVGRVIKDIPKDLVREIIVVNNNSNDKTANVAAKAGAVVLDELRQGYGFACLKGIDYLKKMKKKPDIVVFLDADYSDYPEETYQLVAPILESDVEMVIGSRTTGNKQQGSMTPQQVFGNWLATKLIKWFYGVIYTDLGPFRAIRYDRLIDLNMCDETYGWTVEMQVKAAKHGLKTTEIPVSYRVRVGKSKISGTIKGTILAGYKIITTIFKHR